MSEVDFKVPAHWEVVQPSAADGFADDGRDYSKPSFRRLDGKARFYFNKEEEGTEYQFGIVFDIHEDGDCCGDFDEAIKIADDFIEQYPL